MHRLDDFPTAAQGKENPGNANINAGPTAEWEPDWVSVVKDSASTTVLIIANKRTRFMYDLLNCKAKL